MSYINVLEALRAAVLAVDVKALARHLRLAPGVLYAKVNISGQTRDDLVTHHKPTLADLVGIISYTGNKEPLAALCRSFDGVFVQLPDLSHLNDAALLEIVLRCASECGDVHRVLNQALESGDVSVDESKSIDSEIDHVIAAYLELRARVRFIAGRTDI